MNELDFLRKFEKRSFQFFGELEEGTVIIKRTNKAVTFMRKDGMRKTIYYDKHGVHRLSGDWY